jgi:hypothetical protein
MAVAAMESFRRAGARVVGVVMNRIPRNRGYYYGGYKYYSSYSKDKHYYSAAEPKKQVEETMPQPSLLHAIARDVDEPVRKPVSEPAAVRTVPPFVPGTEEYLQRPAKIPVVSPNLNDSSLPPEIEDEDDGEHPPLDKLFANMTALPSKTQPINRNNGKNNGHV